MSFDSLSPSPSSSKIGSSLFLLLLLNPPFRGDTLSLLFFVFSQRTESRLPPDYDDPSFDLVRAFLLHQSQSSSLVLAPSSTLAFPICAPRARIIHIFLQEGHSSRGGTTRRSSGSSSGSSGEEREHKEEQDSCATQRDQWHDRSVVSPGFAPPSLFSSSNIRFVPSPPIRRKRGKLVTCTALLPGTPCIWRAWKAVLPPRALDLTSARCGCPS